jgi:hypothetical protein
MMSTLPCIVPKHYHKTQCTSMIQQIDTSSIHNGK